MDANHHSHLKLLSWAWPATTQGPYGPNYLRGHQCKRLCNQVTPIATTPLGRHMPWLCQRLWVLSPPSSGSLLLPRDLQLWAAYCIHLSMGPHYWQRRQQQSIAYRGYPLSHPSGSTCKPYTCKRPIKGWQPTHTEERDIKHPNKNQPSCQKKKSKTSQATHRCLNI